MDFVKMHGLGNDFIMLTEAATCGVDYSTLAKKLCDRRCGIGADGIIIVCKSASCDTQMRIFNSDGSEAEMCGNGIRCFARFVYEQGIIASDEFTVETLAGVIRPKLIIKNNEVSEVRVNMGRPDFLCASIPVKCDKEDFIAQKIAVDGTDFLVSSVLMGVPHTVVITDSVPDKQYIEHFGSLIEKHSLFPKRTNVNFTTVVSDSKIIVRTWERGCGMTYACGTGSVSAAVCCKKMGLCKSDEITVALMLGELKISTSSETGDAFMQGSATISFHGSVEL